MEIHEEGLGRPIVCRRHNCNSVVHRVGHRAFCELCKPHWSPEEYNYHDDFIDRNISVNSGGDYADGEVTDEMQEFGKELFEFGGLRNE